MNEKRRFDVFLTEQRNSRSMDLDLLEPAQVVDLFLAEEAEVDQALTGARNSLATGIEWVADAYLTGRVFLVGAGTSGRLGVIEAAECPPTFRTDPSKIVAVIAGGRDAVFKSQEGAEDEFDGAQEELKSYSAGPEDLIIGIAASGVTPFVQGALETARELESRSILITCNPEMVESTCADLIIGLPVGPEILTGSTRLKAGTATKRALNVLTTGAMARIGKVYDNLMVDVKASSAKLKSRAARIVAVAAGLDPDLAAEYLDRAGGSAKVAIVMAVKNVEFDDAVALLDSKDGNLREVLEEQ
jgi:N-acetylmuramic acid 6-phosphate etherase